MKLSSDKEYRDSILLIKQFYKESSNYIHSSNEENCSLIDGMKKYISITDTN